MEDVPMGLRFPVFAAIYIAGLLMATDGSVAALNGVTGIMAALGGLLVLSVIALWPNSSRANRVDRRIDGSSWADRIDMDSVARQRVKQDG
jgi:hypothetical protein